MTQRNPRNRATFRKLIDDYGGVRRLHEDLTAYYGKGAPSIKTVFKWRDRDSIPFAKFAMIYRMVKENGLEVDVDSLLYRTPVPRRRKLKGEKVT